MAKERLKRLYAPYELIEGKWVRATWKDGENRPSFFIQQARRIYQTWLLAYPLGETPNRRELRPVPLSSDDYAKYNEEDFKYGQGKRR